MSSMIVALIAIFVFGFYFDDHLKRNAIEKDIHGISVLYGLICILCFSSIFSQTIFRDRSNATAYLFTACCALASLISPTIAKYVVYVRFIPHSMVVFIGVFPLLVAMALSKVWNWFFKDK